MLEMQLSEKRKWGTPKVDLEVVKKTRRRYEGGKMKRLRNARKIRCGDP